MNITFESLGLDKKLLEAMEYMGFKTPTPIQKKAIPEIISGHDLIACAQTGTGKTGAFLLPILNDLIKKNDVHTNTLIIVPTRELAMQINEEVEGLSYFTNIRSLAMYGGGKGKHWNDERDALEKGCQIVITTPGKMIAHLNLGYVNFAYVERVILDEADRMLDIGFHDDIVKILSYVPKKRQSLLFSATMPPKIRKFANKILKHPKEISLSIAKPAQGVMQEVVLAFDNQKNDIIVQKIKENTHFESIIIFSSTKKKISSIVHSLKSHFKSVEGISSDFEQSVRESIVSNFKSKKIRIIVATDVLARGIDVKELDLVINYDVPRMAEDYVHRIGRTARANLKGCALTLVNVHDMWYFNQIEKLIGSKLHKNQPPDAMGKGPRWYVAKTRPTKSDIRKKNPNFGNKTRTKPKYRKPFDS